MILSFPPIRYLKKMLAVWCLGAVGIVGAPVFPGLAQSRILFVGNSFTHGNAAPVQQYNAAAITDENFGFAPGDRRYEGNDSGPWGGVPGIFKRFTDQAGLAYDVHIEAITGQSLEYHFDNALSVMQRAGWDRVVLQEGSTRPLPTGRGGEPALFFSFANQLERAIHAGNSDAKIYLYQTWARADLTYPDNQPYSNQPIEAMSADLHDAYYQALAQNSHFEAVAPVGDAWLRAIRAGLARRDPNNAPAGQLNLWAADETHASRWGSYLAASVLFGQITGRDPRSLGAGEQAAAELGIEPAAAAALQQVAYEQVNGVRIMTQPTQQVAASSYTLVNADTNLDLQELTPGATLNLATLPTRNLNIRVNTNPATVEKVVFELSGKQTRTQTESVAPYALFSDRNGDYSPWTPAVGSYSLSARSYLGGIAGPALTISFSVIDQAAAKSVALTLTTAGGGKVTRSPDQPTYPTGTLVTLTATPAADSQFNGWSGDAAGMTNPVTIKMTSDKNIIATFGTNSTTNTTGLTFYRGLNVNGEALTIDGQNWESGSNAADFDISGNGFSRPSMVLNPATDAARASMIRSSVYGSSLAATLRRVPVGTYNVYLYVWEDNNPEIFDIQIKGQLVQSSYHSGAAGHWERLGPFITRIDDGTLDISTSGGYANLSGIEVWRQTSGSAASRSALAGTSAALATEEPGLLGATSPQAYPNPSANGRFRVVLPAQLQGKVSYVLLSPLGARLASGKLESVPAATEVALDFSREMTSTGEYILLLTSRKKSAQLRLVRQ